ncbi:HEPN domain-containing protein [Heliorestis acidaminivorans]|uniref:HEPN domain-containing protein n=1 Tax=Heliorestis acidaminivorans TaxID=553427 RepID=A0A6I0EQ75_9FIRM|nr:HEPN domain-containing protein [Heliorestis acidaminivorans]KAB2951520.1 HEPN domain-containing protein [Heliorestis acidaminivorans]
MPKIITVSRLCYSVFYAVAAVLTAMEKEQLLKKHSAVRAAFHLNMVKTMVVPKKFGSLYDKLFEVRHRADYQPMVVLAKEKC